MVDQVFNIYTARGYEGDFVDSGHSVRQTGVLLTGTLGFGKAVQTSGTGQGIAVGSPEIGASSTTNVWGISIREYNHEAGTRPSDGTDFLYRANESVSVLREGYIYLKLTGATAIAREESVHVVEATGLFTKVAVVAGTSAALNVYAVQPAIQDEIFKARIDINRLVS